ncbi:tetratricopeptide repeat protein [Spirochaeta isovalerica]|uniref:Tetratricopeptide (TPR) repeat protein n=1 Tax=Spirochaeta isovalerica TaxID=150 RepID=A0A841RB56_9SPIO|nr:tetratricopeptide repeat protein [Spirochaeta isovalerica]MBB6480591.1 tetratricopeptide (TPR) repeat protein [Spirochaeta isovalerica]
MNLKKIPLSIIFFATFFIPLSAQVQDGQSVPEPEKEVAIAEVSEKIQPVLPGRDTKLIFVEGEDAVSTNFNREPILNYSCSGYRTLQLNQSIDLHGQATYNSDYVFYVEEDGVYELWYGGTPPGNRDETITSYASPFRFVIDSLYSEDIYREDVNVVEEYAPSYYWNYVSDVTLAAGEHRIKFEVLLKRSLDNRYYFYLDNFFLVRKINGTRVAVDNPPEIFPEDMDIRSIDLPFKSFEDYEVLIRDNPEIVGNYVELAKTYSLAGDYINALKYLRRAALLSPDEPEIMLQMAKNLIWRGAVVEGLRMYSDLLAIVPERVDLWAEAGKIAAWTGLYDDSIGFFESGLENSPDNLNLLANLGITHLWLGELNTAEKIFNQVQKITGDDLDKNRALAEIFRVNGYADKAVPLYRKLINLYPEELELYFDLEETYKENDQRDKVQEVRDLTEKTFIPNQDYVKVTETFYESQSMKEKVISDYEEQLKGDPENLNLRRMLAEIYFWNGYRKKAIDEFRNILTSYTYDNVLETEKKMTSFLEILDRSYALTHFLETVPASVSESRKNMTELLKQYDKNISDLEALKKKNDAAEAKGETVDRSGEESLAQQRFDLEEKLAVQIYLGESFTGKFNSLMELFNEENRTLEGLLEDEKTSAEAYELLMEGIDWKWNRGDMITELNAVKKDGVVLANLTLGKILMFEGKPVEAEANFKPIMEGESVLDAAPFALYEAQVWLGDEEERKSLYESYPGKIEEGSEYAYYLNDYLDVLYLEEEDVFSYLTGDPAESIASLTAAYGEITSQASVLNRDLRENIAIIHKVLQDNMKRGFYNLASQTYLLRNELGDFYYNEKMYSEGIAQYEQVLAIDPWNLSAKFKLAQVYHYNGNWSKALKIYSEIYDDDPQFNNVASFYNELTREFADSYHFSASSFSDPTRIKSDLHADYNINFTPLFGTTLAYDVNLDRIYRTYSAEGTEPDDPKSSTLLFNKVSLSFPVKLGPVKITPVGGLYLKTDLFGDEDLSAADPGFGLFEYIDPYFYGGADAAVNLDFLSFSGGYRFDWLTESFHPSADIFFHQVKGNLGINFVKTKIPFIEDLTLNFGGEGKFLSDDNILWNAFASATEKIQLVREPAMYLNAGLDFSLESGKFNEYSDNSTLPYWAPDMSLMTGLNLEYEAKFPLSENRSLEEKVRLNVDYTSSGTGAEQIRGMAFEVGNRLSYNKSDFTAFFNVTGTFSVQFEPADITYWSLIFELGVSALLPELLMP